MLLLWVIVMLDVYLHFEHGLACATTSGDPDARWNCEP